MANARAVLQQKESVSFNRQGFLEKVVFDDGLSKKELRVLLLLLTKLNGYVASPSNNDEDISNDWTDKNQPKDPLNFSHVDEGQIATTLGLKKKQVYNCMDKLVHKGILEIGSNETIKNGYRFII